MPLWHRLKLLERLAQEPTLEPRLQVASPEIPLAVLEQLAEDLELPVRLAVKFNQRGVSLTRYVGMAGEVLSETQLLELQPRDRLLLCSDGLTNMLDREQLLAILNQELSPQSACQRLISATNVAGSKDNITVVSVLLS